jgi:hypothetical protein
MKNPLAWQKFDELRMPPTATVTAGYIKNHRALNMLLCIESIMRLLTEQADQSKCILPTGLGIGRRKVEREKVVSSSKKG